MSISDPQKVDYLWKKIGYGAAKTDISTIKDATNEAIPSPLILRGDIIWNDAIFIPASIPDTNSTIVEVYSDNPNTEPTVETIEDITSSPRRTWITNKSNWIPPEFGSTYQIKVYIDNPDATSPQLTGSQIFAAGSGNNDQWFFDYQPGVLNFIGSNLPPGLTSGKKIYISGARYVGSIGLKGSGGVLGDLTIEETTISTIVPDLDIILDPVGIGEVKIASDLTVENDLNVNGKVVFSSDLSVENDITIKGDLNADKLNGDIDGGFF